MPLNIYTFLLITGILYNMVVMLLFIANRLGKL
jgi:hypothetical protein